MICYVVHNIIIQAQVNSGIYYSEYLEIKRRADAGDKEAKKMLMPP